MARWRNLHDLWFALLCACSGAFGFAGPAVGFLPSLASHASSACAPAPSDSRRVRQFRGMTRWQGMSTASALPTAPPMRGRCRVADGIGERARWSAGLRGCAAALPIPTWKLVPLAAAGCSGRGVCCLPAANPCPQARRRTASAPLRWLRARRWRAGPRVDVVVGVRRVEMTDAAPAVADQRAGPKG